MASINHAPARFCTVCQLTMQSDAELAIHEFSKKHCDNLIRLSRNLPVKTKATKPAASEPPKKKNKKTNAQPAEPPPVNIALYGYFQSQSQIDQQPKEFNIEYDPYLQKFAENVDKQVALEPIVPTTNVTSFSTSKKKKKRACQICGVVNLNIPEYEAHMRSSLHISRLKVSGMGINAHFVKAGADLHTTENLHRDDGASDTTDGASAVPISPSELFCDVCGLLLNSTGQYQAHIIGASHLANVQKKEKKPPKLPNSLFCYSCQLTLTNLAQFNDHKVGKKHKKKCHILLNDGITVPVEERNSDINFARYHLKDPPVYPEGYEEEVLKRMKVEPAKKKVEEPKLLQTVEEFLAAAAAKTVADSNFKCSICDLIFKRQEPFEFHLNSEDHAKKVWELKKEGKNSSSEILKTIMADRKVCHADAYGRRCCGICAVMSRNDTEFDQHLSSLVHKYAVKDYEKKRMFEISSNPERKEEVNTYFCKLCTDSHPSLTAFYMHLHTNNHKSKILKFKRPMLGWSAKDPGVRTKIRGFATDLETGATDVVDSLEPLESKIDGKKNVRLGISKKTAKKTKPMILPARRLPGMVFRKMTMLPPPKVIIPSPSSTSVVPPPAPSSTSVGPPFSVPSTVPWGPRFRRPGEGVSYQDGVLPPSSFVPPPPPARSGLKRKVPSPYGAPSAPWGYNQRFARPLGEYGPHDDNGGWGVYGGRGYTPRYPTQYPQPRSFQALGRAVRHHLGWKRY